MYISFSKSTIRNTSFSPILHPLTQKLGTYMFVERRERLHQIRKWDNPLAFWN